MMNLIYILLIMLIIPIIIMMLNLFFSMNMKKNREKMLPFECGFDPLTNSRLPFSIQFYMITLMFLIFDIEIILMIPFMKLINLFYNMNTNLTFMLFLMILMLTLWLEWSFNLLKWIN
nr:NADH dehydrogenase subunit 3 [Hylaeus dilatatus]AJG02945.1 NADH dehydrogenase subunit 3 [Hylaeus dilatatus]